MTQNTRIWLHTIGAAFISSFSTSASGMLMLPSVFNFSHDGLMNMIKVSAVPALAAVFGYLKASPLPPLDQTIEETHAEIHTGDSKAVLDSVTTTTTAPKA
jgi:hypothetical protein